MRILSIVVVSFFFLTTSALGVTQTPTGAKTKRSDLQKQFLKMGIQPIRYRAAAAPELIQLGRDLFFDKILSGNKNISCATCHHPTEMTGDGLSLPFGEGGIGLGTDRRRGLGNIIPRNAPHFFNAGSTFVDIMMWDSRISRNPADGSLQTPEPSINGKNPRAPEIASVFSHVLEVQALFPVTSHDEMRGQKGTNEIADAPSNQQVWSRLMNRLEAIPEYREAFEAVFQKRFEDLNFAHAAVAIAAFEDSVSRGSQAPFQKFLKGQLSVLNESQIRGAQIFLGKAQCVQCHSGPMLSDYKHHALAVPQLGPGKESNHDDPGLFVVTRKDSDRYKFRTPTLHNISLTGPYMHDGAFLTLEDTIEHHLDCRTSNENYNPSQLRQEFRTQYRPEFREQQERYLSPMMRKPIRLTGLEKRDLLRFLQSLTDPQLSSILMGTIPTTVPSGLPVRD